MPHHTTPHHTTPHHTTLLPKIRVACIYQGIPAPEWVTRTLCLGNPDILSRFVRDDDNPDYVIATDMCLCSRNDCLKLKHYLRNNKDSIFIFFTLECIDPDLNIFDYVFTWNPDLVCGDRVIHNVPEVYRHRKVYEAESFPREEAMKILEGSPNFCNFIYSHPSEHRDTFFRLLSKYRRVDSLGACLNNTGTKSTRNAPNFYGLSIEMKKGYKFSIAMENSSSKGYTTEKIISSLQAHTVPIYWGDPAVTEYINPAAIINCNDYSSFDEVVERVKEVDSNDELWLDMVTQPLQTEEQHKKTLQAVEDYSASVRNIFSQDLREARRRPIGFYSDRFRRDFTGLIGVLPPIYVRAFRKMKRIAGKFIPASAKPAIKKFLGMD